MPLLQTATAVPELQRNEFAHLQLEIARRADGLARSVVSHRATDLSLRLRAEQEVFARHWQALHEVKAL
jgi:hypothetical protein